jgi:hypothetical protein
VTMHDAGPDAYDDLFAELKTIVTRMDPVPEPVRAAARGSAAWQTIDSELAELVYDSVVDDELVGMRGSGGSRQLTFHAPGLTVELEVDSSDRRLQGQIVPPREAEVEIRHPAGSTTVRSDALGHFGLDRLPAGPVSLRWAGGDVAGGTGTTTDWVVL